MIASERIVRHGDRRPLLVAAGVAALVGLVGFLSPCVLPLVPGYLSYVAGLSGTDERHQQRRMVTGAVLFVLGFTRHLRGRGRAVRQPRRGHPRSTPWSSSGSSASSRSCSGLVFLGGFSFLQREARIHRLPPPGLVGAPLLGAAFGLAWAPVPDPDVLRGVRLAYQQGTAGRGAFLMAFYCLGLGIPFVLVALGFGWVSARSASSAGTDG